MPSQMWSDYYPEAGKKARMLSALDRLANFNAVGPAEEMLATMLVNTNEAYLECQRRAMMHADDPRTFAVNLGYAERLSKLLLQQIAALDKHRARGKQQVRVVHVHVASGGKAIVGHLDIHAESKTRPGASSNDDRSVS
jgi:hypothetical protein